MNKHIPLEDYLLSSIWRQQINDEFDIHLVLVIHKHLHSDKRLYKASIFRREKELTNYFTTDREELESFLEAQYEPYTNEAIRLLLLSEIKEEVI